MDIRLGSIPPDAGPRGDAPKQEKRAKGRKPPAEEPAAEPEPAEDCYIPSEAGKEAE